MKPILTISAFICLIAFGQEAENTAFKQLSKDSIIKESAIQGNKGDSILQQVRENIERQQNIVPNNAPPDVAPKSKLNPYSEFMVPYDSTQHLNPKLSLIIVSGFLLFVIYVVYRVRRSLKDDED